MSKLKITIILFFIIIFAIPLPSYAAVTFGNTGKAGLWECDFNNVASDWTQTGIGDVPPGGCGFGGLAGPSSGLSEWNEVKTAAGRTGRGFRFWMGSCQGGINCNTGGLNAAFPTGTNEAWIRVYYRFQSGIAWSSCGNTEPYYKKMIYWYHANGSPVLDLRACDYMQLLQWGTNPSSPVGTGYATYWADGNWHSLEWYLRSLDGLTRVWVDGNLIMENTTGSGIGDSASFLMPSNQRVISSGDWYMDVDDVAIATPSYTGFVLDAQGNKMIGLVGATPPPPDTTPPAAPSGVTII